MSSLTSKVFQGSNLNDFMSLDRSYWKEVRNAIQQIFAKGSELEGNLALLSQVVVDASQVQNHLPVRIGDYTDFYSSRSHAFNVGSIIRGPANALNENWLQIPIGYHGRASSIVVSGAQLRRPRGLIVVMQGLILLLVFMVRPHFNPFQKLRSIVTWVTTLLGGLIVLLKPNGFFMPAIFLILLSLHLVMSVGVIVISLIQQIKRKCNDRSEVVRRLMKEGQVENQKAALRELILRYQNIERKDITIDHEVEKIQLKFNDKDKDNKKAKCTTLQQIAKIQGNKDEPDQEMIHFEDQIIEEQHDHFRFQKGMEFFNKYDGNIDKQLVNQEYPDIE